MLCTEMVKVRSCYDTLEDVSVFSGGLCECVQAAAHDSLLTSAFHTLAGPHTGFSGSCELLFPGNRLLNQTGLQNDIISDCRQGPQTSENLF